MHPLPANENRLLSWARVREFAVPPPMIESATARRAAGDWAGACAAARVDVDVDLRATSRAHGAQLAARVRADLRHLAPDLLRWHFPRIAPDGLLRPGLTVALARYGDVQLVARTPPAWADAGQRISLALWSPTQRRAGLHPHPRPDRRYRLDLHRHLWDVRRTGELRERSGRWPPDRTTEIPLPAGVGPCAVDRWMAEAALLPRAEGSAGALVSARLTSRHRLTLDLGGRDRLVLPDAATWVLPDLELLHAGLLSLDQLHPLVASALRPGYRPRAAENPDKARNSRLVDCRGATHRIGVVHGVLVPLDHDHGEIRREELLGALGGPELPCLRAIDEAHRSPENLVDVRARLDHGDAAGALAAVETLLGPDVLLRSGALRDELETAVRRQVVHGLYRAGLARGGPLRSTRDPSLRAHPRHATTR
ncbi:hypothetical protein CU254_23420 [Amycolatopsis sp. AA4]|uniref:hypothetical protein n=1 Tax=Actinomycetes TaxID=1760 RepID=UPI0001B5509C|nr:MULTISPECIES: hypothetical protein [Actinomycetes]ATY13062.1 hypothetical protein CU254_23420 [Amycolatopsis sp. AA4]